MHTCICRCLHINMHMYKHVEIHENTVCLHMCKPSNWTCKCMMHMYVCMHVRVHVYVCVYMDAQIDPSPTKKSKADQAMASTKMMVNLGHHKEHISIDALVSCMSSWGLRTSIHAGGHVVGIIQGSSEFVELRLGVQCLAMRTMPRSGYMAISVCLYDYVDYVGLHKCLCN